MNNHFARNLRYLRTINNHKQEDLAKLVNINVKDKKDMISRSSIGRWETEDRSPSVYSVLKIAEVYNVPMEDIIAKDLKKEAYNEKEARFELFKKALKEKGFMQNNDDLTEEEFNILIEDYNSFKKTKD